MEEYFMTASHTALVTSRTAEVFALDDGAILKLFYPGMEEEAASEAHVARLAQATGVRCPQVLGCTESEGRSGIIYSRVYGTPLARWLGIRRPWRIHSAGRMLAQAHADLHTYHAPELPSLRERMERDIRAATVAPTRTRALALQLLQALPDDDILCHGDLTTENILLTADGPVVIDWPEATHGDPAADVARTLIHLAVAHVHYDSRVRQPLARFMHAQVSHVYFSQYQRLRPENMARVNAWLLPVAVSRVARLQPTTQQYFLKLIEPLAARAESL
jgi:aminoglycoside phosphotransferase (APT) family kinase protein